VQGSEKESRFSANILLGSGTR